MTSEEPKSVLRLRRLTRTSSACQQAEFNRPSGNYDPVSILLTLTSNTLLCDELAGNRVSEDLIPKLVTMFLFPDLEIFII